MTIEKIINIDVENQKVAVVGRHELAAGTVGLYGVRVRFDEEWEDLETILLTFIAPKVAKTIEYEPGTVAEIPWEALADAGTLMVGVYGIKADGTRKNTTFTQDQDNTMILNPAVSTSTTPSPIPSPTPDIWTQIQLDMGKLTDLRTEDKSNLVAAINEIAAKIYDGVTKTYVDQRDQAVANNAANQAAQAQTNAQAYADQKVAAAKAAVEAEIPTDNAELENGAGYQNANETAATADAKVAAHNENNAAHADIRAEISGIEGLLPEQVSQQNKLATEGFVNSSIQTNTAHFRGAWASWAAVPTDGEEYPADATGNHKPTNNDYLVVQNASDYPVEETAEALVGTWRFKYTGAWDTEGKDGWKPEYQVNEEPLTAAQIAALNSGITAAKVEKIDANEQAIAENAQAINNLDNDKVDKETGKGLSANDYTNADKNKLAGINPAQGIAEGDNGYASGAQVFAALINLAHKALTGTGAPTTATAASEVGQWYLDTAASKLYYCSAINTAAGTYTWAELKAGSSAGVKTLTASDYNYPASNPNGVALWLLDAGLYQGQVKVYKTPNSSFGTGGTFVVMKEGTDTQALKIDGQKLSYWKSYSNGQIAQENETLNRSSIIENLTTTYSGYVLGANQGKALKDLYDALEARVRALEGN